MEAEAQPRAASWRDGEAEERVALLMEVVGTVRTIRGEMNINPGREKGLIDMAPWLASSLCPLPRRPGLVARAMAASWIAGCGRCSITSREATKSN